MRFRKSDHLSRRRPLVLPLYRRCFRLMSFYHGDERRRKLPLSDEIRCRPELSRAEMPEFVAAYECRHLPHATNVEATGPRAYLLFFQREVARLSA